MCINLGHICTKYDDFMSKPAASRGVQTPMPLDDNDNYARRTNNDYTDSFGIVPKEPKTSPINIRSSKLNLT